jgi:hypothetical protein
MADTTRYTKTEKGTAEIRKRGRSLSARLRTMLILIDPSKTGDELRANAAQIGVDEDFLAALVRDGYVAPVAGTEAVASTAGPATVSSDELARFRAAKSFLNDTVVDALGVRAFMFTLRLERCSTRSELAELLPDYAKAIAKFRGEPETRLLVDRARELVSR